MSGYPVIPFHRLSIATNLDSEEERQNDVFPHHSNFTSFALSSSFPDFVHAVDVISDAENIKKLLKMPFDDPSKSVSMVVHRIGKSILIDELDMKAVQGALLAQEKDSNWLQKVLLRTSHLESLPNHSSKDSKPSTPSAPEQSLLSKYLSQSLKATPSGLSRRETILTKGPTSPARALSRRSHTEKNPFARNIVWNFEDIRMLIGSDMPIFGDAEHPCVSLRLRNAKNPINILTGLDYWLDNLMCQVPEVLMCFHVDGIVQRYELYKTEDLPSLGGCKFSPSVVRDVARNILSFLRSNATQEGHTYWLFKAQNEDVVKLYDLTSLGEDFKSKMFAKQNKDKDQSKNAKRDKNEDHERGNNPFKTAVTMLLYKVARNLMESDERKCEMSTIRRLLKNCLALLDSTKYPQIATSTHYMLSDLLVPDEINPAYPDFSLFDTNEDASKEESGSVCNDIELQTLLESRSKASSTSQNTRGSNSRSTVKALPDASMKLDGPESVNRCRQSLIHVVEGFKHLDALIRRNASAELKPNEAIPMPYSGGPSERDEMKIQIYVENKKTPGWIEHFMSVLFKKAFLVYVTLAELYFTRGKYGQALRSVKRALELVKLLEEGGGREIEWIHHASFAWGVAGDSYMCMVKQWSHMSGYNEEYNTSDETDAFISERIESKHREWNIKLPIDLEEAMLLATQCFKKAEELFLRENHQSNDYLSVLKRLGNVENEIGVLYMHQAAVLCESSGEEEKKEHPGSHIKELFGKSLSYLEEGIGHFRAVKDPSNIALLNSNIGRLWRLQGFYSRCENIQLDFNESEFDNYSKAVEYYENALSALGNRKGNPLIWDSISWDLSSTLFSMGSFLQDFAPFSARPRNEVDKSITDCFNRALKYLDTENKGPKLLLHQLEAGRIHHHLASMYTQTYRRDQEPESRRHHLKQLAELHYSKAENFFLLLNNQREYLSVMLEKVRLIEFQIEASSSPALPKSRMMIKGILELYVRSSVIFQKPGDEEDATEERAEIIKALIQRLQKSLLSLNKLLLSSKKGSKARDNSWCKTLYSKSLKLNSTSKDFPSAYLAFLTELKAALADHS
ncbi:uncharacterized protein FKW44_017351 [Caligus rogercresseyi]|uniref:Erythroid differentiation-related factor 1 n=1 Tax=Caligus rogercresseyi TaxID=217165 RepID=A0A7T8GTF0_CALRO|nr:uncharacterized protein FKW44_017351 [Caligus rogercresseyi]